MGPRFRRIAATLLSIAVVTALPASASALTGQERAELGIGFIVGAQRPNGSIPAFSPIGSTSDAVLAFVATGVGRPKVKSALRYLRGRMRAGVVESVGLQAKVIMAVSASGHEPRAFADTNMLRELRSQIRPNGHIGDASVFDQALAVLALRSAGMKPAARVTRWLAQGQCPDGGWAFDARYAPATDDDHCDDGSGADFFTSDSNTTSYVVQAMEAVNRVDHEHDPFAFFDTVLDPVHGGWAYSAAFLATDTNSTALVLQAHVAADMPMPPEGRRALRQLQNTSCGAWAYTWDGTEPGDPDVGATIGAIPAILRLAFPYSGPVSPSVPPTIAC